MHMVNETGDVVYNTLYSGAYFGELAMLTKQRRTATALAVSDCLLFFMTASGFEEVAGEYPMYYFAILEKAST